MRFLLLLAVTLWAVLAPSPTTLRWYFRSNLCYVLVLQPFILLDSSFYGIAWTVCSALNLTASLLLTLDYLLILPRWPFLALAGAVCGAFFGILALSGLEHSMGFYKAVNVVYGSCLIALAVPLGLAAEQYKRFLEQDAKVALALSLLWFGLAGWSLGWPMYWHLEVWQRLNFVLPTCFVMAAFSYVGWLKRLPACSTQQPAVSRR